MNILDLLADGATENGVVRFLPDREPCTFADLWRDAEAAADWLTPRVAPGDTVAAVLTSSRACLATIVGAWRSGATLASIPLPARGQDVGEYLLQTLSLCQATDAKLLLADAAYLPLVPEMPLPVGAFESCFTGGPPGRRDEIGSFVQFTSGSTGFPKGVRLSLDSVGANVLAILETVRPQPDDALVSWLPFSHDMGLMGCCLTTWSAAADRWAGSGTACFMRPEDFLRRPAMWLEACDEFGATHTAAPNFGLELAAKVLARRSDLDLRRMRAFITGAEAVRAPTLRALEEAGAAAGFPALSLCPAYGLAEATLCVTIVPPDKMWEAETVSARALWDGEWQTDVADDEIAREVVGVGSPVRGCAVRIEGHDSVGEIAVASDALLDGYVGVDEPPTAGGWLHTGDLGTLRDGQLFVVGRNDDFLSIAGRNVYARELEEQVDRHPAVRAGNSAVIADDTGRYVVYAEPAVPAESTELRAAARSIRSALAARFAAPRAVHFVPRGSLPKTPSGKLQRHKVAAAVADGSLEPIGSTTD